MPINTMITVAVDRDMYDKISSVSKAESVSKSEVVRRAIAAYLEKNERRSENE